MVPQIPNPCVGCWLFVVPICLVEAPPEVRRGRVKSKRLQVESRRVPFSSERPFGLGDETWGVSLADHFFDAVESAEEVKREGRRTRTQFFFRFLFFGEGLLYIFGKWREAFV